MFPWLTSEKGFIFRITALENLPHLLQNGICCRNCTHLVQHPEYVSIGDEDIIGKRDQRKVDVTPFGTLSDYVPFYFAPRSPMLYRICKTNPLAHEQVVYIVSRANVIAEANIPFVFSFGHSLMAFGGFSNQFFSNQLTDFDRIDWEIMRAKYWHRRTNTNEEEDNDNDRQRRRMAEFLVYQQFPVSCIQAIVVGSETAAFTVGELVANFAPSISVRLRPEWYF